MITNAQVKQYKSLHQKKFRKLYGQFMVQGDTIVKECCLSDCKPEIVVCSQAWYDNNADDLGCGVDYQIANAKQLSQMSSLKTPAQVLAIMPLPESDNLPYQPQGLVLALDCIQDPGNLGTVIRIADWYGISTIVCSQDTADVYNPKVIQSTMGAFLRVNVRYANLEQEIAMWKAVDNELAVYGSFMDGVSMYDSSIKQNAVLVMGNEGQGISAEVEALCSHRIAIPNYPENRKAMESLNISIAAGILCAEFRRAR